MGHLYIKLFIDHRLVAGGGVEVSKAQTRAECFHAKRMMNTLAMTTAQGPQMQVLSMNGHHTLGMSGEMGTIWGQRRFPRALGLSRAPQDGHACPRLGEWLQQRTQKWGTVFPFYFQEGGLTRLLKLWGE